MASINVSYSNASYSELNALFIYNATLIKIHLDLISKILAGYKDDQYLVRFCHQVQANENLGDDKAILLFIIEGSYRSDSDFYMVSRSESLTNTSSKATFLYFKGPCSLLIRLKDTLAKKVIMVLVENSTLPLPNKINLFYQFNRTTGNLCLCIPLMVAPDILQIVHEEGHPSFSCCYKIVT